MESMGLELNRILRRTGIEQEEIDHVLGMLDTKGPYGSLFPGLRTHHLQLRYCREQLQMVVSTYT